MNVKVLNTCQGYGFAHVLANGIPDISGILSRTNNSQIKMSLSNRMVFSIYRWCTCICIAEESEIWSHYALIMSE